jgi:hypothetical protein
VLYGRRGCFALLRSVLRAKRTNEDVAVKHSAVEGWEVTRRGWGLPLQKLDNFPAPFAGNPLAQAQIPPSLRPLGWYGRRGIGIGEARCRVSCLVNAQYGCVSNKEDYTGMRWPRSHQERLHQRDA